jgi:hypothetical protein
MLVRKSSMKQRSKKFALSAPALAVSVLLAACGGSDGGDAAVAPDGVAPTLVIDDNVTAAKATASEGRTTFIFTFSESVGTSFTASDITVSGGSPVALIKVNDTKYLLEVKPAANTTGTMSVSVAAGAFADLGGIPNTSASTRTQDFDTVPVVPPTVGGDVVLASFDGANLPRFEGFNGAETSAIAAGPAGGSGNAGKIIRLGGEVWAGAKANVGPIALTASNRTISARVYSPTAGVPMVLKLENESDANINTGDMQATQAVVVGWQTLTWVVPADKVGPAYSWVVMLPNLGTKASTSPGETYYFDDIKLVVPPASADLVLSSFDGANLPRFEGFNGAETSAIAAGPAGGSGNAGKIIRLGGEVWAGAKANVGPIPLTAANRTISARVYSPTAGVPMVLKLENESDAGINTGDMQAKQVVVAGWQTLTWEVPAGKVGPSYSWVVMLPNLGTKASTSPGETYYFDDIKLVIAPPPTETVLASFDETTLPRFEGFNGAETSAIAAGPAGGSGNAGKIIRLGGEVWAGAKANVGPIALTASKRTISARVYSAVAGVPMVLKLENESDAGINTGDIQATQTVVVGWQTLTWVVPADKVGPSYSWVVMLPNLGTKASASPGETYFFDDIKLGGGS